ncbi:MAG: hypothetical protein CMB37_04355 [Euryarchaeota archaeon]|nr:hypothetical protein [Euryarchaeota archaeon]MEC7703739.1 heavy metal-binding domain-containing protein [Candidatus Thermoplasmatota archaeon]MED5487095.1 heavy metal-binding domain-containing protein [Candidatus Thermoplasmatota archaeon]|tara:strand:- start:282 stop:773 length:492 start_codon:yes stop_codon:yes gene_type:complete
MAESVLLEVLLPVFFVLLITVGPWAASLIGTFFYQSSKKKKLLVREQGIGSNDNLTNLRNPIRSDDVKEFKMVWSSVVMSPSWFQQLLGGIMSLFGGQIDVYRGVVDWARREAQQRLREQVQQQGFDEVINVRMETSTLSRNRGGKDKTAGVEILVYGTAIKY